MTEGNHEKNPSQFGQHQDLNSELSEYESSVTNFDRRCTLCIQKLYHRLHFTVGGCWNESLHLQPLQLWYCENSESPTSTCIVEHHYSITYMQLLHARNGLVAAEGMGNLLCGRSSYIKICLFQTQND